MNGLRIDSDDPHIKSNDPVYIAVNCLVLRFITGRLGMEGLEGAGLPKDTLRNGLEDRVGHLMEVSSKKKSDGKHLKRLVRKAQENVSAKGPR